MLVIKWVGQRCYWTLQNNWSSDWQQAVLFADKERYDAYCKINGFVFYDTKLIDTKYLEHEDKLGDNRCM